MASKSQGDSYQPGDWVPFHLSPGIVVASFFVSLVGSVTTVELLHRRVNRKGWYNWFQLGACAVSLGLISIWCMHYVGNRAIVLGDGDPELQLVYNAGFTALSVFLPVGALFVAFIIADLRHNGTKSLIASIISSGVLTGFAIVGMHYVGNLGVSNYDIVFDIVHVGGAIIIACVASLTALSLFFWLQELWLNILPYRMICAIVIAGAVSGMHFEASMGTSYRLNHRIVGDSDKRNINVIIATILCLLTIPVCLSIALATSRRRKLLADRAQQVVLACARFDSEGRLMVTHEGLLPCQKITVQQNQRSFEDAFTIAHPAFQWIYRASHNWNAVSRFVPSMRRHLQSVNFLAMPSSRKLSAADSSALREATAATDEDYSVIFRQGFCVAAYDLASELKEPLSDLGALYGGIMMTGTLRAANLGAATKKSFLLRLATTHKADIRDVEAGVGSEVFGKGQLLFLVRHSSRADQAKSISQGYRYASIDKIIDHLSKSMQVPTPYAHSHLLQLRSLALANQRPPPSGVVLACFTIRPGLHKSSWDILCRKSDPNELPLVQLSATPLAQFETSILAQLDGLSVTACLATLDRRQGSQDRVERMFCAHFKEKIMDLTKLVAEPFFRQAILSAKVLTVPTRNLQSGGRSEYGLVAFYVIPDVHVASCKTSPLIDYYPLSFFRCRQRVSCSVNDFDRQVHHEFASMLSSFEAKSNTTNPSSNAPHSALHGISSLPRTLAVATMTRAFSLDRRHSVKSILSNSSTASDDANLSLHHSKSPFGGILVSSDVEVESQMTRMPGPGCAMGGKASAETGQGAAYALSTRGHAATADDALELPTYVDELYTTAVARWRLRP